VIGKRKPDNLNLANSPETRVWEVTPGSLAGDIGWMTGNTEITLRDPIRAITSGLPTILKLMAINPFPDTYIELQAQPPLDERVGLFSAFELSLPRSWPPRRAWRK
jgi:hypothetical protein